VSVAPPRYSTGIQNKILDASFSGIPSLITEQCGAGLDPGFPVEITPISEFSCRFLELLSDPQRCRVLGKLAAEHVRQFYIADNYACAVASLLSIPLGN